jgi:hypothetical protein
LDVIDVEVTRGAHRFRHEVRDEGHGFVVLVGVQGGLEYLLPVASDVSAIASSLVRL